MSQRDVPDVSFDTWVRDLETVVDAAGFDRFPLLGISRGGPIAIAYAVKHPERVTQLVLYGAFAAGMKHVGTPQQLEARRALASLLRLGWGLNNPAFCRTFTCRFIPEATPEHEQWFDELQRVSTSPENAARLMERDDDIDVRPLLSQVRTPTLVIHCDRDHAVPPETGSPAGGRDPGCAVRLTAERESPDARGGARLVSIPRGARFVPELVTRSNDLAWMGLPGLHEDRPRCCQTGGGHEPASDPGTIPGLYGAHRRSYATVLRCVCSVSLRSIPVSLAARQDHHGFSDQRATTVMGFDQARTNHHFLLFNNDGGAIEVSVTDPTDTKNREAIRSHLPHIAMMFGEGNFDAPMLVHDSKNVPGTKAMTERKGRSGTRTW